MRLPQTCETAFFYETLRPDGAAWCPAVAEVCAAHHIESDVVSAFAEGSNLVAAVAERWVVKIFPPFNVHQWESERRALAHLRSELLPLKIPVLVADGTRDDGWP